MKKKYVIDTNVFLSNSDCLDDFAENNEVIIPFKVLDEIDEKKERQDSVGANARGFIRKLDELREKGSLADGVSYRDGVVRISGYDENVLPDSFDMSDSDNQIIAVAETEGGNVTVISRDLNLRVKCDSLKVDCEDYTDMKAVQNSDVLYKGHQDVAISRSKMEKLYNGNLDKEDLDVDLHPHQFVSLSANGSSALARNIPEVGISPIMDAHVEDVWGISPKNKEQNYAMDALLDDNINLVTLVGRPGAGKTLLSMCAGLQKVFNNRNNNFKKFTITRPTEPVGNEIGFLPGTFEEKMHPWLKPIKDNVEQVMGDRGALDLFPADGEVEIEALSYIRGRSMADSFVLLDEAQQCSKHQIKTILTRVAENSKIVLTGDIKQIDNPYVDETSNGLTHAVEKFKDIDIAAHCTLQKGERSNLASIAAEVM